MTGPPPTCCNGACHRKAPILIRQGGFTGRWYAATRYKDRGNGVIEAIEKHDVTDQIEAIIRESHR